MTHLLKLTKITKIYENNFGSVTSMNIKKKNLVLNGFHLDFVTIKYRFHKVVCLNNQNSAGYIFFYPVLYFDFLFNVKFDFHFRLRASQHLHFEFKCVL